jgi:hypothetical protein
VESFNSRVRDELLAVEVFSCLAEAKVMIEDYRVDYNRCRRHRYPAGQPNPPALTAGGPMNGSDHGDARTIAIVRNRARRPAIARRQEPPGASIGGQAPGRRRDRLGSRPAR